MKDFFFLSTNKKHLITYAFFLFFISVLYSQERGELTPVNANLDGNIDFIGKHIAYFEEDGHALSIDDIEKQHFTKSEKNVLNFGYSTDAVWLRFKVQNSSDKALERVFTIKKALQDSVQLFSREGEHWKVLNSGHMISRKDKDLPGFSISFPLEIKERQTNTYYVRMVSKWGKTFAVKILDMDSYRKEEQKELVICCFLIGILLTITVYNFFMARALKDPVYDIYCIAVLGALSVQLYFRGFVKLYIVDENPFLQEWTLPFSFCFATLSCSYFCMRFLDAKAYSKYADWALKSVIVFNVIAIFYPLINYEVFGNYTDAHFHSYSAMHFCIVAIFSGIIVYYKGNRSARFLIFGWAVYFLGIILFSLGALDIIPANAFTINAYLIGSVFEVFMLSSALADRYKQLKRARIQLEKEISLKEKELVNKDDKISSLSLETLKYIKTKQFITEELKKVDKAQEGITVKEVLASLQADKIEDKKLEILKKDIDALNLEYMAKLKLVYPKLTKSDMELASFMLLGLTRREIALLRNTSFDAVKKSIHRFRKKIDIKPEETLEEFITSLGKE